MKSICLLAGVGAISLLAGCASAPVTLAPVGPNPAGATTMAGVGSLRVYSRITLQSDDQNQGSKDPAWYQHTDYYIYRPDGQLVKYVDNTIGHYEQAPRLVALPAGKYEVKAGANDYLRVDVPVIIAAGRTTTVHLDDHWKLPPDLPKTELVSLPDGNLVGWRAETVPH